MARIKKYENPNEKYAVYKAKKPQIRVSNDEKDLIKALRANPEVFKLLFTNRKNLSKVVTTTNKVVTTTNKVVTTPNLPQIPIDIQDNNELPQNIAIVLNVMLLDQKMKTKNIATLVQKSVPQTSRDLNKLENLGYVKKEGVARSHNFGWIRIQ